MKKYNINFIDESGRIMQQIPNLTKKKVDKYLLTLSCGNYFAIEIVEVIKEYKQ